MTVTCDRISELVIVLDRLSGLYQQLAGLAREKLAYMGRADLDALRATVAREEMLVRNVQEQDGLRRKLLELIGKTFGMAVPAARRMTASQLLQRVEQDRREEIERAVQGLRRSAAELSEANRIAGLVASQVLTHLREVFTAVTRLDDAPDVYTARGKAPAGSSRMIFEATG